MVQVKFGLPEELREALKAQAAREYSSEAQIIRRALRTYLTAQNSDGKQAA